MAQQRLPAAAALGQEGGEQPRSPRRRVRGAGSGRVEAAGRSGWKEGSRALPTVGLCRGCIISRTRAGAAPHPPSLLRGFCLIPYAPFLFFFLTEEAGSCI